MGNPMLAGAKNVNPVKEYVRYAKGQFLASGTSGILELSPCGHVMKSPWPGQHGEDSRRDIITENEIYKKLGRYPRLVQILDWNLEDCVLTMEYMPNGNLQTFLVEKDTTEIQRLRWVQEAAEGVQLLHDADVLHCDINPKNFLLDARLGLKIADFGGSSLEGSMPSAWNGTRFSLPDKCWRDPPAVQDDLFALGTTIYFIMTCQLPFPELSEDEVEANYRNHKFPDVSKIPCGQAIERCWLSEIGSAQEIYEFIPGIVIANFAIVDSAIYSTRQPRPCYPPQTMNHHAIPLDLAFIAVNSPRLYELGIGCGRYSTPEVFPAGWSTSCPKLVLQDIG